MRFNALEGQFHGLQNEDPVARRVQIGGESASRDRPGGRSAAPSRWRLCALLRGEKVHPLRQDLPIELMARDSSARAS
jgi:hypothetical protein